MKEQVSTYWMTGDLGGGGMPASSRCLPILDGTAGSARSRAGYLVVEYLVVLCTWGVVLGQTGPSRFTARGSQMSQVGVGLAFMSLTGIPVILRPGRLG